MLYEKEGPLLFLCTRNRDDDLLLKSIYVVATHIIYLTVLNCLGPCMTRPRVLAQIGASADFPVALYESESCRVQRRQIIDGVNFAYIERYPTPYFT